MSANPSDLVTQFKAGELLPDEFDHLSHLRVAYEILSLHDFVTAVSIYVGGIRALAEKANAPEKFNAEVGRFLGV